PRRNRPLGWGSSGKAWHGEPTAGAPLRRGSFRPLRGLGAAPRHRAELPERGERDLRHLRRQRRPDPAAAARSPPAAGCYGTSAGGHLAAILATAGNVPVVTVGNVTVDLEGSTGGNLGMSSRVQAAVDWYGASDVLQMFLYASSVDHNARLSAESKLVGAPI